MKARKQAGDCLLLGVLSICSSLYSYSQGTLSLVGAGSNVPSPLYADWTEEYKKRNPTVEVRYLSTGTMQSIRDISSGIGDFGAGEVPMTDEQLHSARTPIVHIPTVLVAIVPIYNSPGVKSGLRFSGEVLAQIFLGRIKRWDDPRIAKLNPETQLPHLDIVVVHRTEGKGSNYILTDFLSKVSPEWRRQIGKTPSPAWPVGMSAQRGEDMMEKVRKTEGAIGYVELGFTEKDNSVSTGMVQNAAGRFVKASSESILAAYQAMEKSVPADFRVSLANAPGKDAYPMSSFTWLYVPVKGATPERSAALADYLNWVLTTGQQTAQMHGYTPLPASLVPKVQAKLRLLR